MSFLLFQITRACGLNFICTITHVTQINVKWFVFFSAIIKCRFKRVPVDFGPALEFRPTRRRSLSRFTGREDKFSYSSKILSVKRFVSSLPVSFFYFFHLYYDVYRILGFYRAKANLLDAGLCFFDSLKYNNNNNDKNKNKWSKNSSYTAG